MPRSSNRVAFVDAIGTPSNMTEAYLVRTYKETLKRRKADEAASRVFAKHCVFNLPPAFLKRVSEHLFVFSERFNKPKKMACGPAKKVLHEIKKAKEKHNGWKSFDVNKFKEGYRKKQKDAERALAKSLDLRDLKAEFRRLVEGDDSDSKEHFG
jgi:hypothetical protein